MEKIKNLLEIELIHIGEFVIRVNTIVSIIAIYLITKLVLYIIKKILYGKVQDKLDIGENYALYKIIKYVMWVLAFGLFLDTIGIELTVLLAGSAALLVGIGLGLQQTFNDILSGIILLSEKTIKIEDILEIDGDIVKIQSIGLRTSKAFNTDDVSIIIPNSIITSTKVINWSHQKMKARFRIDVGVAYGSDIDLVIKILEESANDHPSISDREATEARLVNFGNSSLDFQVLFYSEQIFQISRLKSDIRRTISKNFTENNIRIPYPQMDLHFKSNFPEKDKDK